MWHARWALALLPLVAGCARPPGALRGTFPPLTPGQAQRGSVGGERVRWGGQIIQTRPEKNQTCFEIVSKPLDRRARPKRTDDTDGRFIACAPGFDDPAVYAPQRDVTVVGTVQELVRRKVGEYEYRFPTVRAETVHLWPKPEPQTRYYYDPWYDPFWGWGGGTVIVPGLHHRH